MHVAARSPIPARPANVCGCAPSAEPSRAISASPRVISAALVLSPCPIATATPIAIAMMFLTAPPSSHPITSEFVYGRKYGVWQAACKRLRALGARAGHHGGGELPPDDLARQVRPGDHGHPPGVRAEPPH